MSGKKRIKVVYLSDRALSVGLHMTYKGRLVGEITHAERLDGSYHRIFANLDEDVPVKDLVPYTPPAEVAHLLR